ncbi:alpha/beta hydrolase [Mycolicibacterium pulveris]|uniref:alpha/beta hydrolase n=1 Tax=Mycolicibacterium pulveris TaxID=36813 RepID=UPI003CF51484
MGDVILRWFSAGVVTAGVTAAMFVGAGVAIADDDTGAASGTTGTSESSDSADPSEDSATSDTSETTEPDIDDAEPAEEDELTEEEEPAEEEEPEDSAPVVDEEEEEQTPVVEQDDPSDSDPVDTSPTAAVQQPATQPVEDVAAETEPEDDAVVEADDDQRAEAAVATTVQERTTVVVDQIAAKIKDLPKVEAVTVAAAAPAVSAAASANPLTVVLDFIGNVVFGIYAAVTRIFGGPAMLPLGSTVTVRGTTLRLDCACAPGEGKSVPVDWYFPEGYEEDPPDRMIYLQHGFLAAGPWYSYTANALAAQTNSIVVAPTITSNFLAADACWLGAAPMHQAMAGLFDEDNTALAESAARVGYTGPIPDRVVLMGHSLGGGAVSAMAGYMVDNGTIDRLAGVILLDGVGLDDPNVMRDALAKVPLEIPIYQIAAPVYFWNNFGVGIDALVQARPDQFVGVTLVGGSHVDAMRGGNPLIQFAQQVVSGFSQPRNVAAARHLMVTWTNDMFAGNQATGVYDLGPGEGLEMRNPGGLAIMVGLPNTLTKQFPLNLLEPLVALAGGIFRFEPACVAASVGSAAGESCSTSIAA